MTKPVIPGVVLFITGAVLGATGTGVAWAVASDDAPKPKTTKVRHQQKNWRDGGRVKVRDGRTVSPGWKHGGQSQGGKAGQGRQGHLLPALPGGGAVPTSGVTAR